MKKIAILLVMVLAASAQGEDIWDPPWVENPSDPQWAGGATTYQRWEFSENQSNPVAVDNIFGTPLVGFQNASYPDDVVGPDGNTTIPTWHIDQDGGSMTIFVPNNPLPNAQKIIFIQITSDKGAELGSPTSNPPGSVSYPKPAIKHGNTPWYTYTAQIDIPFNPPNESITYTFPESTNISEVVVDTICVPEPAALGWLLFAGGAMLRCRRLS
jgi:hypothetical protein